MFIPKTDRIKQIAEDDPRKIAELEKIFNQATNIYIDYANVRPWANKLRWHIDMKRLKQFLDSFDTISSVKIYNGTLVGDEISENLNKELEHFGYELKTKPVKIMKKSIDVSSIRPNSSVILENFIRKPLLQKFKIETIEYLNFQLQELNKQRILYLEDKKCNFDVEMGRDMLTDYDKNGVETFILWSGDSDFADPIEQLLKDGKRVYIFATARKVASELNELQKQGLMIYDIQKIRNFICWKKELSF